MKSDKVYTDYALSAISKIKSYTSGLDKASFLEDSKTQSATIMQLVLIGELAKRLSDETKSKIDLPWRDIAGFRDRAIHDYFEVDLEIVWQTILEDIPTLETELLKYNDV
jgi:uncharacterized protein with HEPN domain